ncbi:hypothetical protein Tco_0680958 [Tanacetum coccineum]|uniref:Uncharacterized protein n=1 Tax=Tanacetum coccineum TaxID=301880 RepID=A0ABQ4XLY5_9ASTR
MAMSLVSFDKSKSGVLQLPYEGRILAKEGQSSKKSRLQEQGKHKKDCACGNIHFHSFGVMLENGLGGYDWSDQAEEDLIMHSHGFTHLQVLTQRKSIVDQLQERLKGYNAVPPPYTGNFMPPTPDLSFTGLDEFVNKPVVENRKSDEEVPKVVRKYDDAPCIEEWVSNDEEEDVSYPKTEKKTVRPSIVKKDFDHLQVDCNYHQKQFQNQRMIKPVWKYAQRVNHQNFAKKTHPCAKKNLIPRAVLMKSGLVSVNTGGQVNAAHSKIAYSTVKRLIHENTTFKNSNINQRVNTVRGKKFNTARPKAVVNAVKGNDFNVVKASAC